MIEKMCNKDRKNVQFDHCTKKTVAVQLNYHKKTWRNRK